jgi:hypothetical protein
MAAGGTAHSAVKRELLVRYLDACIPALVHGARRVSYAEAYPGSDAIEDSSALAALRVFAEFADLFAKRRLDLIIVEPDGERRAALAERLDAERAALGLPDTCRVHARPGPLLAALAEIGALGAPVLALIDQTAAGEPAEDGLSEDGLDEDGLDEDGLDEGLLAALAGSAGGEALQVARPGHKRGREALQGKGFALVTEVELVDSAGDGQLLRFATNADRHLDVFKDALWAVDEYAGVRYRDPADPEGGLLDITLNPHLAPLRRVLLARLRERGSATVEELRGFARSNTVYRVADATKAVQALASAGMVTREPDHGRLTAETLVRPAAGGATRRAASR